MLFSWYNTRQQRLYHHVTFLINQLVPKIYSTLGPVSRRRTVDCWRRNFYKRDALPVTELTGSKHGHNEQLYLARTTRDTATKLLTLSYQIKPTRTTDFKTVHEVNRRGTGRPWWKDSVKEMCFVEDETASDVSDTDDWDSNSVRVMSDYNHSESLATDISGNTSSIAWSNNMYDNYNTHTPHWRTCLFR